MPLNINISSQIKVQTAAQWAVDATVYSAQMLLVTSDQFYNGNARKFKVANGIDTWAAINYYDLSGTDNLSDVLTNGNKTGQKTIESDNGKSILSVKNAISKFEFNDGFANGFVSIDNKETLLYYTDGIESGGVNIDDSDSIISHTLSIQLNAPIVTLNGDDVATQVWAANNFVSNSLASSQIIIGSAGNIATSVNMSGGATIDNLGVVTLSNSAVTGQPLTGYVSGAGVVAATDSILQAIQKLNGNISALGTAAQKDVGGNSGELQENGANLNASEIVETNASKKFITAAKNTAYNKNFGTGTTNVVEIGATLGNSEVVETNGSGKIITAAKNTAYNKNFGTASNTVCEGNDARILKIPKVYAQTQLYTLGAVTTEVVSYNKLIPAGTIVTDDLLQTYLLAIINNSTNAKTVRFYFSTAAETVGNAPSGSATLWQTYSTAAGSVLTIGQLRMMYAVRSNTSIFGWLNATSTSGSPTGNNAINSTAITVPTFANDVYFVVTGQKANSGDTLTIQVASMIVFKKE